MNEPFQVFLWLHSLTQTIIWVKNGTASPTQYLYVKQFLLFSNAERLFWHEHIILFKHLNPYKVGDFIPYLYRHHVDTSTSLTLTIIWGKNGTASPTQYLYVKQFLLFSNAERLFWHEHIILFKHLNPYKVGDFIPYLYRHHVDTSTSLTLTIIWGKNGTASPTQYLYVKQFLLFSNAERLFWHEHIILFKHLNPYKVGDFIPYLYRHHVDTSTSLTLTIIWGKNGTASPTQYLYVKQFLLFSNAERLFWHEHIILFKHLNPYKVGDFIPYLYRHHVDTSTSLPQTIIWGKNGTASPTLKSFQK